MVEKDCITLDNKEYAIVEELNYDNHHYVYLVNLEDEKDIMFREETIENGEYYYSPLESDEEFNKVLEALCHLVGEKYKK